MGPRVWSSPSVGVTRGEMSLMRIRGMQTVGVGRSGRTRRELLPRPSTAGSTRSVGSSATTTSLRAGEIRVGGSTKLALRTRTALRGSVSRWTPTGGLEVLPSGADESETVGRRARPRSTIKQAVAKRGVGGLE